MAYSKLEPLDEDVGISQPKIVANFTAIETYIKLDHESFDDNGANAGLHTKVTLVEQAADPTAAANKVILYSKEVATVTEQFMLRADGTVIQLSVGNPTVAAIGQTFLPGGIIMKWGNASIISGGGGTQITFAVAFPNNCFDIQLTPLDANPKAVTVVSKTKTSFYARGENAITVMWRAIGN